MDDNLPTGGLNFEVPVTADVGQHNAAMKSAEQAAEQYAQNAGKRVDDSAAQMQASMKATGKAVSETIQTFTKFVAIPGMILGVAATFYKLGQALREGYINVVEDASAKSERFFQTLDKGGGSTEQQLSAVNKQIQELTSQLDGSRESNVGYINNLFWGAGSPGDIEKQLSSLETRALSLRKNLQDARDAKDKAAAEAEAKRVEDAHRQTLALQAQAMDDKERISFETENRVADLRKKHEKESNAAIRSEIEQQISWEYQIRNQKLADLAVKAEQDKRRQQEQEEQADEKLADARNDLARKLLDEREAIEFDYVRRLAELERQLDKETSEARKRLIEEQIELEAELREKAFSDLMRKQFTELLKMRDQLEANNNQIVYSLGAVSQQLNSIISKLSNP